MTQKELRALTVTGSIYVHIDAHELTPKEATRLVQKFKLLSEIPDLVNTLTVINVKKEE